jgi:hypothetical protein
MRKLRVSGKREEDPKCKNHQADAALYAWRYCYQYLAENLPKPKPRPGSPEALAIVAKRATEEIDNQFAKEAADLLEARREQDELEDMGWT